MFRSFCQYHRQQLRTDGPLPGLSCPPQPGSPGEGCSLCPYGYGWQFALGGPPTLRSLNCVVHRRKRFPIQVTLAAVIARQALSLAIGVSKNVESRCPPARLSACLLAYRLLAQTRLCCVSLGLFARLLVRIFACWRAPFWRPLLQDFAPFRSFALVDFVLKPNFSIKGCYLRHAANVKR